MILTTEATPMRVSSSFGSRPTCSSRLALWSRIQSGRWDLKLAQSQPQTPSSSPRSLTGAVPRGEIAGRAPAESGLLRERVVEGLDLGVLARDADARAVVGGAEIEHL